MYGMGWGEQRVQIWNFALLCLRGWYSLQFLYCRGPGRVYPAHAPIFGLKCCFVRKFSESACPLPEFSCRGWRRVKRDKASKARCEGGWQGGGKAGRKPSCAGMLPPGNPAVKNSRKFEGSGEADPFVSGQWGRRSVLSQVQHFLKGIESGLFAVQPHGGF